MKLSPIRDLDGYRRIREDEREHVVQPNWAYNYDVDFITGVPDPMDWSVWPEAVGKRACDAVSVWQEFWLPKPDFSI